MTTTQERVVLLSNHPACTEWQDSIRVAGRRMRVRKSPGPVWHVCAEDVVGEDIVVEDLVLLMGPINREIDRLEKEGG